MQSLTDQQCKDAIKQFAGSTVDALCTRPGGKFATIFCGTQYVITPRGTLRYVCEWQHIIANKDQWAAWTQDTSKHGFITGRPTARKVLVGLSNNKLKLQSARKE